MFHVSTHSVWTSVLFRDDIDRLLLLTELAKVTARFRWRCVAACLMTTHYHLIVEVPDGSMPIGMKHLNLTHAARFNARHKLRGHVVDGRYWSRRLVSDAELVTAFRYVARNPVEAGACRLPGEWPWSSYGALADRAETFTFVDPSPILNCFRPADAAVEQLRRYVESPLVVAPWGQTRV
jgi:REP element-mobilizing transposase RayT